MTAFADAAGAALLRAVDDLAAGHGVPPDAPELERARALARSLQLACSYFESGRPVTSTDPPSGDPTPAPLPAGLGIDEYRRIAAAGGDAVLIARLLHRADVDLVERLKALRTVFDLPLDEARTIDDLAREHPSPTPRS